MIIALAQISPLLGDVGQNIRIHAEIIERARKEKADLVVFPELSLTGYNLKDLAAEVALVPEKDKRFRDILSLSRTTDLVVGFVEDNASGLIYNAAAYLRGGRMLHLHRKVYLPTSGMFDEARFFAQGKEVLTFDSPFGRAGLMICRDFLHLSAGYLLQVGGAGMVIVISAAPGRGSSRPSAFDTSRMWELMGESLSFFSSAFVIYCNRAGYEDGMVYAGGSFLYGPTGRLMAKAAYAESDFLLVEVDPGEVRRARRTWPWVRDDKPEVILQALQKVLSRHED